eukprot:CAMPEP_0203842706 /NCGR_PEP_ID=MMETSP0359-20131031/2151_1 /ASSEMBLY_ACC=CAM_ASM_000338 /TAXON_ID=268821 /ORGANISM="Scrippsiella Hangoei, Strain SHTV-5" /LENGTH=143 /DNA_ID=CAMNT_0050757341 /DNA_START=56 /DNA_END=484 /DNA_ORIENTATION=-
MKLALCSHNAGASELHQLARARTSCHAKLIVTRRRFTKQQQPAAPPTRAHTRTSIGQEASKACRNCNCTIVDCIAGTLHGWESTPTPCGSTPLSCVQYSRFDSVLTEMCLAAKATSEDAWLRILLLAFEPEGLSQLIMSLRVA